MKVESRRCLVFSQSRKMLDTINEDELMKMYMKSIFIYEDELFAICYLLHSRISKY